MSERQKERQLIRENEAPSILMKLMGEAPVNTLNFSSVGDIRGFAPLTLLARGVYGNEKVDDWLSNKKKIRDIWELTSPQNQCMKTIGNPDGKSCWLCGLEFNDNIEALKPICEHVLPIAQAVFFLDLYAKRKSILKEDNLPVTEIYNMEYSWAHNLCNLVKNDLVFIKESKDVVNGHRLIEVDTKAVDEFIKKLKNNSYKLEGIESIKQYVNDYTWNTTEKPKVIDRIQKVVDFINKPIKEGSGNLNLLGTAATLSDVNPAFSTPALLKTRSRISKTLTPKRDDSGRVGTKTVKRGGKKRNSQRNRTQRNKK
jgi:hypothetical protein